MNGEGGGVGDQVDPAPLQKKLLSKGPILLGLKNIFVKCVKCVKCKKQDKTFLAKDK